MRGCLYHILTTRIKSYMPPVGPRRLLLPPTETEWRRGRAGEVVEVACGRQGMDRAVEGNRMSAEERLREIGEILAAGLLRLRAKRATESGDRRETFPGLSRHARASMPKSEEHRENA